MNCPECKSNRTAEITIKDETYYKCRNCKKEWKIVKKKYILNNE